MKIELTEEERNHRQSFIDEIIILYHKYGLALSHEDTQGCFIVQDYDQKYEDWLRECEIE